MKWWRRRRCRTLTKNLQWIYANDCDWISKQMRRFRHLIWSLGLVNMAKTFMTLATKFASPLWINFRRLCELILAWRNAVEAFINIFHKTPPELSPANADKQIIVDYENSLKKATLTLDMVKSMDLCQTHTCGHNWMVKFRLWYNHADDPNHLWTL